MCQLYCFMSTRSNIIVVCVNLIKKMQVITNIINTLKEIPWIRHPELNNHIPCTDDEFHQAKYTLISSIGRAIQDGR